MGGDAAEPTGNERYHAFWERFIAWLIDGYSVGMIGTPTTLLLGYGPEAVALGFLLALAPAGWIYAWYCHGRWGRTFGKHLMGLRVLSVGSERPVTYRRAMLRDVGTLVLSLVGAALLSIYVVHGDREVFRYFDFDRYEQGEQAQFEMPGAGYWWYLAGSSLIGNAWNIAELITMLSNDKRRSLHDYIGGTVVVRTRFLATTTPMVTLATPPGPPLSPPPGG